MVRCSGDILSSAGLEALLVGVRGDVLMCGSRLPSEDAAIVGVGVSVNFEIRVDNEDDDAYSCVIYVASTMFI